MLVLGIESSCDDTAAAVIDDSRVLANVLSSQDEVHTRFGGVVPELASRNHLVQIHPVVTAALEKAQVDLGAIELIAVTRGPGLIGSLLVGFSYAKALSQITAIPLVAVDHMAGHILSIFLNEQQVSFPFVSLVVSGGTSALYLAESPVVFRCLGKTRDDAAGEAFDKVAKLLELPYPGGPHVSRLAAQGDPKHVAFPRSWLEPESLDFSFSGVKTAVLNFVEQQRRQQHSVDKAGVCASFEQAVVDVLVEKTMRAAAQEAVKDVVVCGGVSANPRLRRQLELACGQGNYSFFAPELEYCTDNGAMIAFAGRKFFEAFGPSDLSLDVYSRSLL
jgi:N6-L-threonylcarbamoyladenine synthase